MRRRAFTLIELLVVMAILVLLMTVLFPAIAKAKEAVKRAQVKGQMGALVKACTAYQLIFDNQAPGVVDDPPIGGSQKISGAQNLTLSLMGCTLDGGSYSPRTDGPFDSITDSTSQHHPAFYNPKMGFTKDGRYYPGEYVPHSKVATRNTGKDSGGNIIDSGYAPDVGVIVDYAYSPAARPFLYYRIRTTLSGEFPFAFKANEVYCLSTEKQAQQAGTYPYYWDTVDELGSYIGGGARAFGFAIISAGPDRQYFTSDDIVSWR
ncbi:MAG: type II secretion system protein [Phycisphaerae bacterium]|nr:type II secretion system protein [Phycisphaerae bacterium]